MLTLVADHILFLSFIPYKSAPLFGKIIANFYLHSYNNNIVKIDRYNILFIFSILIIIFGFSSCLEETEDHFPDIVASDESEYEFYYSQKVDHNNPDDDRYFLQRYFYDPIYASLDDAPILLSLCGESNCYEENLFQQITEHAEYLGARIIVLEHRYYGKSFPVENLSADNLQYLTVNQVLQDIYEFQNWFTQIYNLTGKWIVLGGSYGGNLAAYYRALYPEMVVGALASSAPIIVKENFYQYDEFCKTDLGEECSQNVKSVVDEVVEAMSDPERMIEIKKLFELTEMDSDIDLLEAVVSTATFVVQYGVYAIKANFCDNINSADDTLTAYAEFTIYLNDFFEIDLYDYTIETLSDETIYEESSISSRRAWLYQTCTEFGYFQTTSSDRENSFFPEMWDLDYFYDICETLFGIKTPPDVETTISLYYEPLVDSSTTNILFTNGSSDPWSVLSLTDEEELTNSNISIYVIEDAVHCEDIYASYSEDSDELIASRTLFRDLATIWLSE